MKIADRHGRPLSEVLSEYPEWELPFWDSYYTREPDAGRRVEFIVARLLSTFIAVNSKKGHKPPRPSDLVIPDWWAENIPRLAAQADVDELVELFSSSGIPIKVKR